MFLSAVSNERPLCARSGRSRVLSWEYQTDQSTKRDTLAIERRGGRDGGGYLMPARPPTDRRRRPWNKGLLIGQKKPLEPKHVWSIRVRLEIAQAERDLAIFNRHLARILSIASGAPYAESALLLGQKLPGASGGYIHPEPRRAFVPLHAGT